MPDELCVVVGAILLYVGGAIPLGPGGVGILRSVVTVVLVLLGARFFRGLDEDPVPPRPWWRMIRSSSSGAR